MTDVLSIAVTGWVASEPREVAGNGVPYTSFRMAHTPRRRSGSTGEWVDGETVWFTVKAWRDAAFNIAASVSKGDAVLVQGRLRVEHWQREEDKGTTLVLEADAVGHNLMRGTSSFERRKNAQPQQGQHDGDSQHAGDSGRDVDPWAEDAGGHPPVDVEVEHPVGDPVAQHPTGDPVAQHPASGSVVQHPGGGPVAQYPVSGFAAQQPA